MPLSADPGTPEHDSYCSLCYRDGAFLYGGDDVKEFQRISYEGMIASGMNRFLAKFYAWMIQFAPRWKK